MPNSIPIVYRVFKIQINSYFQGTPIINPNINHGRPVSNVTWYGQQAQLSAESDTSLDIWQRNELPRRIPADSVSPVTWYGQGYNQQQDHSAIVGDTGYQRSWYDEGTIQSEDVILNQPSQWPECPTITPEQAGDIFIPKHRAVNAKAYLQQVRIICSSQISWHGVLCRLL